MQGFDFLGLQKIIASRLGFFVLALCFVKDSFGSAASGVLKKPFDIT